MKNPTKQALSNKLLITFLSVVFFATLIRLFLIDIILVSNDSLLPDLYPGDLVFISKVSSPRVGSWLLMKDHPQLGVYSLRKAISSDSAEGWNVRVPHSDTSRIETIFVETRNIKGKALFVLWTLPCKPAMAASGLCPSKASRFFKPLN